MERSSKKEPLNYTAAVDMKVAVLERKLVAVSVRNLVAVLERKLVAVSEIKLAGSNE